MAAEQSTSTHLGKFVLGALVLVLIGGAFFFYSLAGRLDWLNKFSGDKKAPAPPLSASMKNAPGPDNTITELPLTEHTQAQPPSPIQSTPAPNKPVPAYEKPN